MKKIVYSIALLAGVFTNAQVIIGSDNPNPTVKSYAALEILQNPVSSAIQLPVVAITDITNRNLPIKDPVDGMMVYNMDTNIPAGIYVWTQKENNGLGLWVQLADNHNMISSLIMDTTPGTELTLDLSTVGDFKNMDFDGFKIVSNLINATYNADTRANGGLRLIGDSGYAITLQLEVQANTPAGGGSGLNKNFYLHNYSLELRDKNGNKVDHSSRFTLNEVSVGDGNDNMHTVVATFNFPVVPESVTLFPYIARAEGGNYQGPITIKSAKLHIERGSLRN